MMENKFLNIPTVLAILQVISVIERPYIIDIEDN